MNWLDNIINWVSPSWAYKREAWRQGLAEIRHYDAGNYDRLNANWHVSNQSAEITDRYSRDVVRARARDLERNSDMMGALIGAYKRNVVGGGYTVQARTNNEELNNAIEKYWKIWCKKQNCDITGTQSFIQMLRMAVERKKVDGGILFLKRYIEDGIVPFKLQCIEVDELATSQVVPKNKKNKVIGGIEYNAYNRAVGYWIQQYTIDDFSLQQPVFIDAKEVIFYYTKKRPSQVREMSDMSPTLTRIRDANEFMTAVSVKERIGACLAAFIKKSLPEISGIGRTRELERSAYTEKTLTPGMIRELNAGDDVVVVNPSGQATDATSYIKLQERLIGAGQGISYEATARDMSETNYSSARQALIEDDLTYAEEKELLMEIMDEVYETFVISGYLSGLFPIKDFWQEKDNYLSHEWIQAAKKWIDPAKEATANKIALETMQKTFQQIAAENGKDWQEHLQEIAKVVQYAKDLDIDLGGILYGQTKG